MAATVDVRQTDDLVAGPDDLLDGDGSIHRSRGETVDDTRGVPGTSSSGLLVVRPW